MIENILECLFTDKKSVNEMESLPVCQFGWDIQYTVLPGVISPGHFIKGKIWYNLSRHMHRQSIKNVTDMTDLDETKILQ